MTDPYVQPQRGPVRLWEIDDPHLRPVDPSALPPGIAHDVVAAGESPESRAARISDEIGRQMRANDPIAQIAASSGGSAGRGVMAPPSDPGESIGTVALGTVQDVIPEIVERGASLFGVSPDDAASYANTARDVGTGALREGLRTLSPALRGAILSEGSPSAAGGEFIPFSDEITGLADSYAHHLPVRVALDAASRNRELAATQYPNSALTGQVAQGIATMPLFGASAAPSGTGLPSAWRAAVGSGVRGLREGGIIGSVIGADRSNGRPFVTAYDVARGARGMTGNLGLIPEIGRFGADVATDAVIGGGIAGGMGAVSGALGAQYDRLRAAGQYGSEDAALATQQRAYDDAIAARPSVDNDFLPGIASNESIPESADLAILDDSSQLDRLRAAAGAAGDPPLTLRGIAGGMFESNPHARRANAVGLTDTRQMRGLERTTGVEGFSRALDRYGVMPMGDVSTTATYQARMGALRQEARSQLDALESRANEAANAASPDLDPIGHRFDPEEVARSIDEIGDQYAQQYPEVAQQVYDFANDSVRTQPVWDTNPTTGRREVVDRIPRDFITFDEMRNSVFPDLRGRVETFWRGAQVQPTQATQAMNRVYGAIRNQSDEAYRLRLGDEGLRSVRLANNAYHIGSLGAPPARSASVPVDRPTRINRLAGFSTGASAGAGIGYSAAGIPGAAAGFVGGGILGAGAAQRWQQIEPAVMAAMADPQAGSIAARATGALGSIANSLRAPTVAATTPASASLVARIAAAAPESLGRYGGILSDAARRGTVDAVLHMIRHTDPAGAAEIDSAVAEPTVTDSSATDEYHLNQDNGGAPQGADPEALDDYAIEQDERNRARPTP